MFKMQSSYHEQTTVKYQKYRNTTVKGGAVTKYQFIAPDMLKNDSDHNLKKGFPVYIFIFLELVICYKNYLEKKRR